MKNWIKSYWNSCLSITAIICSVVAICVSLPTKETLGIDYIGVIVGILSLLVTMLLGWQIWNTIAIEKKIKEEVNQASTLLKQDINKFREDLSISGVRSMTATLYQAESTNLNLSILANDYKGVIRALNILLEYSIALNDPETLSHTAKSIIGAKEETYKFLFEPADFEIICNSFLKLSHNVLAHLSASDEQVPQLYQMMDKIEQDLKEFHNNHSTAK